MAKYLKPRRGSTASAKSQNMLLLKGELFLDFPNGNIGKEPGRMVIGDGLTSYTHIGDDSGSSTNTFAPMIVHPAIYTPVFADSTPSTSSWTFDAGTAELVSSALTPGEAKLPDMLGSMKSVLVKHANSLNKINQELNYGTEFFNDNATTYDLTYDKKFNSTNKTCIFGPLAPVKGHPLSPVPEYITSGCPFTLQIIKTDEDYGVDERIPVGGRTVVTTQIAYYALDGGYIYFRHYIGTKVSANQTDFRWTDWYKFEDKDSTDNAYMSANTIKGLGDKGCIKVGTKVLTVTAANNVVVFTDAQIASETGVSGTAMVYVSNGDYSAQPKYLSACVHSGTNWYVRTQDGSNFTPGNLRINYMIAIF